MKIFLLITKAEVGGAQMSVLNLARGLKDRGVEVKVGFGEGEFLPQELKKEGIPYTRFKNLKRTHNPLINLFFIREVKKYFDKNKFEVVHINSSNALFAALGVKLSRTKPKTVFTFRGMSLLDDNYRQTPFLKVFYKIFFKFFLKFVDEPVFVSKHNLELGKKLGLVKKENLVYNGLDKSVLNFYTQEEAKEKLQSHLSASHSKEGGSGFLPLSEGEIKRGCEDKEEIEGAVRGDFPFQDYFLIGSIGRLAYQKNYEFLINIFPEILKIKPNAIAVIIGDGPKKEEYEEMIREKKLQNNIFLVGSLSNASRYLKAFDLFILPSRYEGLSITLIETLFAGVPVLTTRVGGNPETLPSEQELYELDKEKDFLEKFKKLISEDLRESIIQRHLEKSQDFYIQKTVKGYIELYKN